MRRALKGAGALLGGILSSRGLRGELAQRGSGKIATSSPLAAATTAARPDVPLATSNVDPTTLTWIHVSAETDALLSTAHEAYVGVWVDAPNAAPRVRAPIDLALVIDTSGSMEGDKIQAAHTAARELVNDLQDGDIVSVDEFSDSASVLVPSTKIDHTSRMRVLHAIDDLGASGSTDMYDGLMLAEQHLMRAPESNPVRRIVVISDGMANVGPSTPDELATLAERGLGFHAQVTSLGVGTDYDEHTLNALAVRTSGRLFHIGDPREMVATLKHELDLLGASLASDAFIEVVPAPGVTLEAADFVRSERKSDGSVRIPVGTIFSGQHKEAILRAHFSDEAVGTQRTLASVRLVFRDTAEGGLERVQEAVVRTDTTDDAAAVTARANARCHAILAMQDAARLEMGAAEQVNQGDFGAADKQLAVAQQHLQAEAAASNDDSERAQLSAAAASLGQTRAAVQAAPAAPPAAQRNDALEMNKAAMGAYSY